MFCGKCGANVPDGNTFCSNCGAPVSGTSDQPAQQNTQPVQVVMVTQPAPAVRSNAAAIVGLVFSIIGLCLFWFPYVGLVLGFVALILSIVGLAKHNAVKGAAIVGLILSIIGVFMGASMTLGMETYLSKARAASASQSAYESLHNKSISLINSEINEAM